MEAWQKRKLLDAWYAIKRRCLNKKDKAYPRYGGRGITIHPAWLKNKELFFDEIGPPPSQYHSVDRRKGDEGYEPGNVRWVTPDIQALNQDRSKMPISSSGVRGVYSIGCKGRWRATGGSTQLYSGFNFDEACAARKKWEEETEAKCRTL